MKELAKTPLYGRKIDETRQKVIGTRQNQIISIKPAENYELG
jgi:hypothetical protein